MTEWRIPPLNENFDYVSAIQALESEGSRPVRKQHVVSKVILKRFASHSGNRKGWQLSRFDKALKKELDPKGLNGCGIVKDFIQYASASAESLWQEVETKLNDAIESAESGTLRGDGIDVIKSCIALHLVRTVRYCRIHQQSFIDSLGQVRTELLTSRRPMLEAAFRRRYHLEPAGRESLEVLFDNLVENWEAYHNSGALLRVSIEQIFHRIRSTLSELSVEVLHTPPKKQLLISDAPAFTFRHTNTGNLETNMAIGDSNGIAMPITKRCFVSIGPDRKDEQMTPQFVDKLNRIQIEIAERQLYYHPASSLRKFIEAVLA